MSTIMVWNAKCLKNIKGGLWENMFAVTMKNAPKTNCQHILKQWTRKPKRMNGKKHTGTTQQRSRVSESLLWDNLNTALVAASFVFVRLVLKNYVYIFVNWIAYLYRGVQLKESSSDATFILVTVLAIKVILWSCLPVCLVTEQMFWSHFIPKNFRTWGLMMTLDFIMSYINVFTTFVKIIKNHVVHFHIPLNKLPVHT